ncbi:hypothetical protein VNI00_009299 [Paramarasmius palmivorus]|uniref:DUF6593 domain-containing protein n=1 Tax=Paramarasmius palmivorus TaxID=297713 RepID=A0AAW0CS38_9AGAR
MPTFTFKNHNIFKSALLSTEDGSVAYEIQNKKSTTTILKPHTREVVAEIRIKPDKECIIGGKTLELRKEAPAMPFEFTASNGVTYKWSGSATDLSEALPQLVTTQGEHPVATFDKRKFRATFDVHPEATIITEEILASIIYIKMQYNRKFGSASQASAAAIPGLGNVLLAVSSAAC